MQSLKISLGVITTSMLFNLAHAADMMIKPGEWEFRSKTSLPTPGGPQERVNRRCFADATISPETMMKDMQQGCRFLESDSDGSSMSWKVSCSNSGGEMSGVGNVTVSGDTLTGGMKMAMSFNGQQMNMELSWDGKYLGPCP